MRLARILTCICLLALCAVAAIAQTSVATGVEAIGITVGDLDRVPACHRAGRRASYSRRPLRHSDLRSSRHPAIAQ